MQAEINDFKCSSVCPFLVQRMRNGCSSSNRDKERNLNEIDNTHNTDQGHSEDYCNFYEGWIRGSRTIPECKVDIIIMRRRLKKNKKANGNQ